MSKQWDIGKEAIELDEKNIRERMKVEKRSIKMILVAFVIYFLVMFAFYIFL